MRRARWKRKHVRRVGLRRRSPPAAGGGRLAVPCGSQRRKRAALGETSSPGRYRDTPCPSPRCRSRSREEAGSAWRSGRRRKRSWSNASLHPDAVGTIRHGTAVTTSQKMIACPKAGQNRRLHRSADPRRAEARTRRSASKRSFLLDRARPVSLLARPKGAPAAPRAVGRGGAREQAQFSPQAETELSGLCDDDNGGCIPLDQPPAGAESPMAAVRRPAFGMPCLTSKSPAPRCPYRASHR